MYNQNSVVLSRAAKCIQKCPSVNSASHQHLYDPVCVISQAKAVNQTTQYFNPCHANCYNASSSFRGIGTGSYVGLCNAAADTACKNSVTPAAAIWCAKSGDGEFPSPCYAKALFNASSYK
jgi:hypothetical protein